MVASTREEYAFQTIDPAVPPQEKASPKRALIVITALMFGLVLGVLAAWWMRLQEGRGKGGSAKELL
jgi:uncharacterized protein involved in exopolysaccharide biosynthesis